MSFTKYDVISPATYVGAENYREMFTVDWGGPGPDGEETVPTLTPPTIVIKPDRRGSGGRILPGPPPSNRPGDINLPSL